MADKYKIYYDTECKLWVADILVDASPTTVAEWKRVQPAFGCTKEECEQRLRFFVELCDRNKQKKEKENNTYYLEL